MNQRTSTTSPSMYYSKMGSGPALVLLHGFPESGSLWQHVMGGLSAVATLLIPDLPGAGKTPLEGDTSMEQMATQVKEMLDKEGIDKAIIAGHSMGGYVALAFAALYPDRVAGISLVHSAPGADDEEKKTMRKKAIELIRKGGKRIFVTQMIPNLFSESFKKEHPEVIEERIEESMKMSDEGMINFYDAIMKREDRTEILKDAKYPLQWIMGEDDNIMPYKKLMQHSYRSDINFVSLYKNCGHMSMYEVPTRLIEDLKQFTGYCYTRRNEI